MKKNAAVGVVYAAICALAFAQIAWAQDSEVLYLADTMGPADNLSAIFKVELTASAANLVLVPNGLFPFNHVDVLAAEPDGSKLWFVDDYYGIGDDTGLMGWYEVADGSINTIGPITYNGSRLVEIDQAAVAPDGTLFIAHNLSDAIYTVDKTTAEATVVGRPITPGGVILDVQGADIAFAADGTFYLWINRELAGAPQGLYIIDLPPVNGYVTATWVGGQQDPERRFTGLAIRANGLGDLVGSISKGGYADTVAVVDKVTGDFISVVPLLKDGQPYDHVWGDMSIGPFPQEEPPETNEPPVFCTYTIGYWKNHSWDGATVTILDVEIDEATGKEILRNAKSKNMSMLFAQLIAAKLNVNNASGVDIIDAAEDFLSVLDEVTHDIMIQDASGEWVINWNRDYDNDEVRAIAAHWKTLLDEFNNMYHCEDNGEEAVTVDDAQGGSAPPPPKSNNGKAKGKKK